MHLQAGAQREPGKQPLSALAELELNNFSWKSEKRGNPDYWLIMSPPFNSTPFVQ